MTEMEENLRAGHQAFAEYDEADGFTGCDKYRGYWLGESKGGKTDPRCVKFG